MNIVKEIVEWIVCIIIALILAFWIRYFILTPTIVKHSSMYPTLKENQRLILDRTFRITGKKPKVGDIITFEAPSEMYSAFEVDQNNPVAKYSKKADRLITKFFYDILEVTKVSYIKRVIAIEGEHVEIKDGKIYINGEILKEEYLGENVVTESSVFNDFVIPEGYVFAVGDNRSASTDSRVLGCIPLNKIEGIAICRFWPLNEITKF